MPASSRAVPRHALALLALLAVAAAAEPAQALTMPRGKVMQHDLTAGPLSVDASVDPSSGQASFEACLEHDPTVWPFDAEREPDGDWAVWVPAGPQEADGSHKAKPTCGQKPPGEPPCAGRVLEDLGLVPCGDEDADRRQGGEGGEARAFAWPHDPDRSALVVPFLQPGVGGPSSG